MRKQRLCTLAWVPLAAGGGASRRTYTELQFYLLLSSGPLPPFVYPELLQTLGLQFCSFDLHFLPGKSLAGDLHCTLKRSGFIRSTLCFCLNKMELEKNIWGANRQRAQDFEGEALFVLWFEEEEKKNQEFKALFQRWAGWETNQNKQVRDAIRI